jgi:hypothetical protein
MNDVGILRSRHSYKEVVWLDVAINEGLVMDGLNSGNLIQERIAQNTGRRCDDQADRL